MDPRNSGMCHLASTSLFILVVSSRSPDLGFYPKILIIFEGARIFLGIYFFEKSLGINLWNFRNCSAIFVVFIGIAYSCFF